MDNNIYIKNFPLNFAEKEVQGKYVLIEGEKFYKISNYDNMRPFFMSIVSDSDHWMFISSNGSLSAGRQNSEHSLFPYYTDDKITDFANITGSKTILRVHLGRKKYLWQPFSNEYEGIYQIRRNIYKNYYGNKIMFEEINDDLGLIYSYCWNNSDKFGFVKKSKVTNTTSTSVSIELLDGIQNIIPSGVSEDIQNIRSTLVDAYKKNEANESTGLGMFMLSAVIVDKPVPSESLIATLAYAVGIPNHHRLLSTRQIRNFKKGMEIDAESDIRAEKGAYFVHTKIEIEGNQQSSWMIVADIDQDHADVAQINNHLAEMESFVKLINEDIDKGTENLINIVGSADGLQAGEDEISLNRHFANVLFNVMRGGIPDDNYNVPTEDYQNYIQHFNQKLFNTHLKKISQLPEKISYKELVTWATQTGSEDLERLTLEYLPFVFSRRHGDPSRPWNRFSINLKDSTGKKVFNYEGNWRDIFQNWEALAISYPSFINGMITKFLNASTIDGYNPYRITKNGIDWEVIEPDDPWSFIGYWGDHQVIYLQKLLEISFRQNSKEFQSLFSKKIFSYADVPYTIKSYNDIVKNPRDTIDFDHKKDQKISKRVESIGADGKMILTGAGEVLKVNFTEKLLVMILTKFSNFIPEAGIWLNTQRPEWNDANNALVGNGVSMVTLYYMYRFQMFAKKLYSQTKDTEYTVRRSLKQFMESIANTLLSFEEFLEDEFSDEIRRRITNELGSVGEEYRKASYSEKDHDEVDTIEGSDILMFINITLKYLKHSIRSNKRGDGLYHAYNLIDLEEKNKAKINRLYEMLEGQVSVLSAGALSPAEAVEMLDALKESSLFREDQYSYILYPDRQLPRFEEKNIIPAALHNKSELLQKLIADGNTDIVYRDLNGGCHFNVSFNNNENLIKELNNLKGTPYESLMKKDKQLILDAYEEMFDHKSFTGRSGTFFGYEGLGSIYWHMVSKLLLAVYENYYWALEQGADEKTISKLIDHYYSIRAGIGNNKGPELYGAFPMDPYSHTPAHKGAQQPGMTGQVKEDILARFGELGVIVKDGEIQFNPTLFKKDELLSEGKEFEYYDLNNKKRSIGLKKGTFAFTYCKVPVIYSEGDKNEIVVLLKNDDSKTMEGHKLNREYSDMVFSRNGEIKQLEVSFIQGQLGI